jgi:hypothetical protein
MRLHHNIVKTERPGQPLWRHHQPAQCREGVPRPRFLGHVSGAGISHLPAPDRCCQNSCRLGGVAQGKLNPLGEARGGFPVLPQAGCLHQSQLASLSISGWRVLPGPTVQAKPKDLDKLDMPQVLESGAYGEQICETVRGLAAGSLCPHSTPVHCPGPPGCSATTGVSWDWCDIVPVATHSSSAAHNRSSYPLPPSPPQPLCISAESTPQLHLLK